MKFSSHISPTLLAALAVCLSLAAYDSNDPPPPLPEAAFEGLGDLPGGNFQSFAIAVSADGSVVVGSGSSTNGREALRWIADSAGGEGGGLAALGDLPGGAVFSEAYGVSADGSVVVGWGTTASGVEAFRWEGGVMTGLGDLAGDSASSRAYGVSADGAVVAGSSDSPNGVEAFRWEGGVMAPLGDLPGGGISSLGYGVSADGAVVVGGGSTGNGEEAFRWRNGSMTALGDLPGGSLYSSATAASADGAVVVGYGISANGLEAFRWEGGTMDALGALPGAGSYFSSDARGVSADGSVIIGSSDSGAGPQAFIWTQADGIRNLREMLEDEYNLDLTGWTLNYANGISADGAVIVGQGTNPNGDTEAWRAFLGVPVGSNQ